MGSFTPLVFGTNGGMGNECQRFLKHLADKIVQNDTEPYHIVITWLRTQISFELLRSCTVWRLLEVRERRFVTR